MTSYPVPTVSVVIVSWNASGYLRKCLQSLRLADQRHPREIILVDNASTEDVVGMVLSEFPEVSVKANEANRGFAGGNNQAMQIAKGRYFLLLNPDTEVIEPSAIDSLVDYLEAHPEISACGPRLNFPSGRHQVGDAGFAPTTSAVIAHSLFLSRLFPSFFKGIYLSSSDVVEGSVPVDVDWICGACKLIRRDVVESAGGFDERLFMYAEDIEWGCRLRSTGHRIHYLPSVRIMHVGGSSEKLANVGKISSRWLTSLALIYQRDGRGKPWLFKMVMGVGFLLRWASYSLLSVFRGSEHYRIRSREMLAYAIASAKIKS